MKLSDIAKRSKRLSIDLEIDPGKIEQLKFDYRPSSYTGDLLKRMTTVVDGETEKESIDRSLDDQPGVLAELICWWDATDEEGNNIAPTKKVFAALDIPLRAALITAISNDINPNPPSPVNSNGGSFTR